MQSIDITNKRGENLAAYLFMPAVKPSWLLIVCHGFRGVKENGGRIFHFASLINELGAAVLAFDFSGSGQSDGDFASLTLSRQSSDLQSVIDYVDEHYKLPIVLLGRSFGGSTAIAGGAGDERVFGYILWSTPIFMAETFAALMPLEYKSMHMGQLTHIRDEAGDYDLGPEFVRDFACHDMDKYLHAIGNRPVLIVQARDDELVAPENALYMQNQLQNVSLHLIEKAGHRFLEKTALRESITIDWLKCLFAL